MFFDVDNDGFKVVRLVKLYGELVDELVSLFDSLKVQISTIELNEVFQMRIMAYTINAHYEFVFGTDNYVCIAILNCNDYHWDELKCVLVDDYFLSLYEVLNIIKYTIK